MTACRAYTYRHRGFQQGLQPWTTLLSVVGSALGDRQLTWRPAASQQPGVESPSSPGDQAPPSGRLIVRLRTRPLLPAAPQIGAWKSEVLAEATQNETSVKEEAEGSPPRGQVAAQQLGPGEQERPEPKDPAQCCEKEPRVAAPAQVKRKREAHPAGTIAGRLK